MAYMTPAERVAQRTWFTLDRAKRLRARFGEETLTDLLVLDMLPHRRARGFWLRPTTKQAESLCGADLLVAVRHNTGLWSRFALQAKKLYPNECYMTLSRGKKCVNQLKNLELFAQNLYAIPLYLLYNYSNNVRQNHHWHCGQPFVPDQLGCTLVPSWHIRKMIHRRPPRNFDLAHSIDQSIPWRCVFDCPAAETSVSRMAFRADYRYPNTTQAMNTYGAIQDRWPTEPLESGWPEWLFDTEKTQLTLEDIDKIRSEISESYRIAADDKPRGFSESDAHPLYPARFLIVDQLDKLSVESHGPTMQ